MTKDMTKDMTTGNPAKIILMFSIPILIGNIFQQLYSMVDTAIVGRYVNVNALAAVGVTGPISFLVIDFVLGLTAGFAVPVAQSFGAKDYNKMRHYVAMSVGLCIFITLLVTLSAVSLAMPLLKLIKTPDSIINDSYTYIVIIFAGMGTTIFYNMIACILRAVGDSKTPLYFLVLASVTNVILDLVFIINLHLGVAGAAYATVISQGISGILCLIYTAKKHTLLHLKREDFTFKGSSIVKLISIGFPMALQYSITATGCMILQSAINSFGDMIVAGFTAASKVEALALQPFKTLGVTMATYTGQNLGAGKIKRIKKGVRAGMIITVICSLIAAVWVHLLGREMTEIFIMSSSKSTEAIEASVRYLNTIIFFFIPVGAIFVYRNALQGMGAGFIALFSGVVELLSRTCVALIFAPKYGYKAVCLASPSAWVTAGSFVVIVYLIKMHLMTRKASTL